MEFEWPVWDSVDWGYDNWLRYRSAITKTHDCNGPEVPRTHHYANQGMHVGYIAAPMYARMALSDGQTPISEKHLETAMKAGSTREYYLRLIRESREVSLLDVLRKGIKDESIVLYFNDQNGARNPVESRQVLTNFQLYPDNLRMRFRGLLTFKVKDKGLRVILVAQSMREYWSKEF